MKRLLTFLLLLLLSTFAQAGLLQDDNPLPANKAFSLDAVAIDPTTISIRWLVQKDYYLYKDKFTITADGATIASILYPPASVRTDEFFGEVSIYDRPIEVVVNLENISSKNIKLSLTYQGCWKGGVCYPPQEASHTIQLPNIEQLINPDSVVVASPEQLSNEEMTAKALFQKGGLALLIGAFLAGLALSYTPCVYPMVPILSGIIIGQKESPGAAKSVLMALVFVVSMSLAYALFGATAGYFGAGVNLQALLQTPWVLVVFSLIFVVLAFSMFGYYAIQLPKNLQNKITQLSNKQNGGGFLGVAIMGFLSALIVGPCVTPFLATALSYVIAEGSATRGAMALFAMGLGMGAPLIVICGWGVNALPKAGPWMTKVNHVFGVLMLAVALYLLDRIIPPLISLALWASLLTIAPIGLGAFSGLTATKDAWKRVFKGASLLVFAYGLFLWLLVARGGGDLVSPLAGLSFETNTAAPIGVKFDTLKNNAQLGLAIAETDKPGQLLLLKFYADWCVSCKKLERTVFSNPSVVNELTESTNLTADVTDNNAYNQALMARFNIAGPPAVLFFVNGKEQRELRIIGEVDAKQFLERLNSL